MAFAAVDPKGMISGTFDCRRACVLSESIKSAQGGFFRLIWCCERLVGVSSRIGDKQDVTKNGANSRLEGNPYPSKKWQ